MPPRKPEMDEENETADRFVPMRQLVRRLGMCRAAIYRNAKHNPDFGIRLVRMEGQAGALNSEVERKLASLPGVDHSY